MGDFFLKEFLECSITTQIMRHPVVAPDGQTYERDAITEWQKRHQTSPHTRKPMEAEFCPNYRLIKIVSAYLDQYPEERRNVYPVSIPDLLGGHYDGSEELYLENYSQHDLVAILKDEQAIRIMKMFEDLKKEIRLAGGKINLMHLACWHASPQVIRWLYDQGVTVNSEGDLKEKGVSVTPLYIAIRRNHSMMPEVIEMLLIHQPELMNLEILVNLLMHREDVSLPSLWNPAWDQYLGSLVNSCFGITATPETLWQMLLRKSKDPSLLQFLMSRPELPIEVLGREGGLGYHPLLEGLRAVRAEDSRARMLGTFLKNPKVEIPECAEVLAKPFNVHYRASFPWKIPEWTDETQASLWDWYVVEPGYEARLIEKGWLKR